MDYSYVITRLDTPVPYSTFFAKVLAALSAMLQCLDSAHKRAIFLECVCVSGVVLALKVPQLAVRRQNLMSAVESLTTIASLHQTQPTIQGCRFDVSPTDVSLTESS